MTEQAISPLRRRMIEDMTIRKFAQKTQHDYVRRVKDPRMAVARFNAVPVIYTFRESAAAGDLLSYASSFTDAMRRTGSYVARILNGALWS
jgi:hypothetical protein